MAERGEDAELGGIADKDVEPGVTVEEGCGKLVDLDEIAQIGRASCRERVFSSV